MACPTDSRTPSTTDIHTLEQGVHDALRQIKEMCTDDMTTSIQARFKLAPMGRKGGRQAVREDPAR